MNLFPKLVRGILLQALYERQQMTRGPQTHHQHVQMIRHRAIGVHRKLVRGCLLPQFVDDPRGSIRVGK